MVDHKFFDEKRCLLIAEISANHNQDFDRAVALIRQAKATGADAVKFQLYTAETLTIRSERPHFRIDHPQWGGQTLFDLYQKAFTPWEWFPRLKAVADEEGVLFFATAFDRSSVDFLEDLDVTLHKIASFELVDLPLVSYAASKKKPLILSTGMATVAEIEDAVTAACSAGAPELALLKCISSYPAAAEEMNLRTIPHMRDLFQCPVGLSDHSEDIGAAVAAVSLGACVIEKHFTDSRTIETPDSFFSMEPEEFASLVRNVRIAERAIGGVRYGMTPRQEKSRVFRRSLFAVSDIAAGEKLTAENVRSIRPSGGLAPKYLTEILGRKAARAVKAGTPLSWDIFS